jgi:Siphovirus ReqiPepy6 Gp37-like protein
MDFYTLTDTFLPKDPIDEFVSAIWTERYSAAGDVQIVTAANLGMVEKLMPGTYLALRGTKEVMLLETQSIEDKKLTVTGTSLLSFLDYRVVWFKNSKYGSGEDQSLDKIVDYSDSTKKPGEFIADVVDKMVINPVAITGVDFTGLNNVNLDWDKDKIPLLSLGSVDTSGAAERLTIPTGPLYSGIQQIAEKEAVGISLYLDSASPVTGYVLKFTTYRGKDRTGSQTTYPLVRLEPDLDSLSDVKEIHSMSGFMNVAYVYYKGVISEHLAEPTLPEPEGLNRRILVTDAQGEPIGRKIQRYGGAGYYYPDVVVGSAEIAAFREQNAKDALANHNYIHAIDGQTSPINQYKYGVDYGLGDIIELRSFTGAITKSRITEYIRTQDKFGEKEYPTIAVINPEAGT